MATGGAPTRKEEDFPHTCSLCMEPYRGRSPKILPCFHTFCLPCLTALQDSVTLATPENRREEEKRPTEEKDQKQSDSNSDEGKKQDTTSEGDDVTNDRSDDVEKSVFLCPSCRAPVSIPEGGVATLQVRCLVCYSINCQRIPEYTERSKERLFIMTRTHNLQVREISNTPVHPPSPPPPPPPPPPFAFLCVFVVVVLFICLLFYSFFLLL